MLPFARFVRAFFLPVCYLTGIIALHTARRVYD
nr:MAG TPA: hypothetical protein [Caudoviricetes sp.]